MTSRSPLAPIRGDESVARAGEEILSVGQAVSKLRSAVRGLAVIVVEGEVTNAKGVGTSGHLYFNLKDERADASIACVMWKSDSLRGGGERIANGARVQVRAVAELYAPRGQLQLQVMKVSPAGLGDLLLRREELKRKLSAEGLFDPSRKRALPSDPRVVGVVTSSNGAAFHDIVKVARRRGSVRILLAPAVVQGDDAPRQLRNALARLSSLAEVDVIILGRGGGSAEDLAAFDDEGLARAIARCGKPVVAAVGHEVDWSIACYVADQRAATPSQAAELVVPDESQRRRRVDDAVRRLALSMRGRLQEDHTLLARARARLRAPERAIALHRQRLDELGARTVAAARAYLRKFARDRDALERRLADRHPRTVLANARGALAPIGERLRAAMKRRLERAHERLDPLPPRSSRAVRAILQRRGAMLSSAAQKLDAISPLAVLGRGYAIAMVRDDDGEAGAPPRALRDAREAKVGSTIEVRLQRGSLDARVVAQRPAPTHDETPDDGGAK